VKLCLIEIYCTCSKTRLTENVFPLNLNSNLNLKTQKRFRTDEMTSFFEKVCGYRLIDIIPVSHVIAIVWLTLIWFRFIHQSKQIGR